MIEINSKRCRRCGETKPASEFGLDRKRRDNLTSYCLVCKNEDARQVRLRRRTKAVAALGGKCVECGYDRDVRALQFDHINGGGGKERQSGMTGIALENAIIRGERHDEIQLLCANCNQIKAFESGERVGTRQYERQVQESTTLRPHGRSSPVSRERTATVSKQAWADPERAARMSLAGADGGYRPDVLAARRPQIEANRAAAIERGRKLAAEVDERRPGQWHEVLAPGSWSRNYERCLGCGTTERRHACNGCCTRCNGIIKGYGLRPSTKVLASAETVSSAPPPPS